jgi:hypothetical protein
MSVSHTVSWPSLPRNFHIFKGAGLSPFCLFFKFIHGSLKLSNPQIQPLQPDGDLYLMDLLALSANLSPTELHGINLCRLFFNVFTLSDVTNASGARLSPEILDGALLFSLQSQPKDQK